MRCHWSVVNDAIAYTAAGPFLMCLKMYQRSITRGTDELL